MKSSSSLEQGRSALVTTLFLAAATAAALYGVSSMRGGASLGLVRLEREAPTASFSPLPAGLGSSPSALKVTVEDSGSGLGDVAVSLTQNGKTFALSERAYAAGGVARDELELKVDPKAIGLQEGSAQLRVVARDHSMWRNAATIDREYSVDFKSPRVEPMSAQQNGTVGGVELVVFRYRGRPMSEGGVESSTGALYRSYPLSAFDSSLAFPEGLYFSLFPIPFDFSPAKDTLRLSVRDDFGNGSTAPFNYRIATKSFPDVDMAMSDEFFRRKVPELREKLRVADPAVAVTGNDVQDFKGVNEGLRKANEVTIQRALRESPVSARLWKGPFVRPLAAAPKASFAEGRRYVFEGSEISRSRHMGVDLADVAQAKVVSSNKGQVVFADDLGIYGGLVIVDHGSGVSSLYGHLSAIDVKNGDPVEQGQALGRTGTTGLAGGDHLHFEIRVQGVPVNPLAWLDARWIEEHIEGKIGSYAAQQPAPQG